jgi:hypothetical protein
MKAGAVSHPNEFPIISTSEQNTPPQFHQTEDNISPRLRNLGFEYDELEMFFDTFDISQNELIRRYLEISHAPPYNLTNWINENVAADAPYITNVIKSNGVAYNKHDIVEDTLNSFYEQQNNRGGKYKKSKTNKLLRKYKKRKTKKSLRKYKKSKTKKSLRK